jgi:hypothetical protein
MLRPDGTARLQGASRCSGVRTTNNVHAGEGTLVAGGRDKGGDATARRGDAAAARYSNGGRRVLGDVLGGDVRQIGGAIRAKS